ncbi:MAG: zinc-binding dehydrogenase [Bacteroidota bacterium]
MKAAFLVKNGKPSEAFEIRETEMPEIQPHEVLIKVHYSGLNFADVLARLGMYPDAPKPPSVVGYDVSGEIVKVGKDVEGLQEGDVVAAMSRFGGYAEYVATNALAVVKINDAIDLNIAPALATQACTALYSAEEMVRLHPGDHVLVHSAAGGVGSILVQIAKHHGCVVYGTVGSDEKFEMLSEIGVDHPINYKKSAFDQEFLKINPGGADVIFDAVGGTTLKKGMKLLNSGGRLVAYGGAQMTEAKNVFQKIKIGLSFGFYHPIVFIKGSKSMLGVNMLRIADDKPDILNRVLKRVVELVKDGIIKPKLGAEFKAEEIDKAHALLESGKSQGKIVVRWDH